MCRAFGDRTSPVEAARTARGRREDLNITSGQVVPERRAPGMAP